MACENVQIALPEYVLKALDVLESAGYEAWCVGGCVRDVLLDRPVNDYDIAASSFWQETQAAFEAAGCETYEIGVKHGTLTVLIDGNTLEITTYRTDGAYSDARHPDNVCFVRTIEEDLARRDFTINALAYHPQRGLLDCFGGLADLRAGVIRAVGVPRDRFAEDALRILRGCRFASQLGFSIEPDTMLGMLYNKRLLLKVSRERITHELQELLLGDYVHDALLETVDVLAVVLPELVAMKGFEQNTPYHIYDVLEHTAYVVQYSPANPLARWAALFHDIGKPAAYFHTGEVGHFFGHAAVSVFVAQAAMERLCLSPSFRDDVLKLVRMHDDAVPETPRGVKRALVRLGGRVDLFRALCDIKRADARAQAPHCISRVEIANHLEAILDDILASGQAFTVSSLAIGGEDVLALGVPAGPEVGRLLQMALDAVIDEQVPNEKKALIGLLERELEQSEH